MDNRYEYYKEQYFFELTRKGQLANSMSIPIGFLTAIFTVCAYFGLNLNCILNHWTLWVFLVFIFIALFFIAKSSYYLFKVFTGLQYGYNPPLDKLYEYELKYKNDPQLNEKFFKGIKKSYIDTTTKNRENNNLRAKCLYYTNVNTIIAIVFIILAAIPFFIGKNVTENKNRSLIKNNIIMTQDEENKHNPSDPDISDFPNSEWQTEGLSFDFPIETHEDSPTQPDLDAHEEVE